MANGIYGLGQGLRSLFGGKTDEQVMNDWRMEQLAKELAARDQIQRNAQAFEASQRQKDRDADAERLGYTLAERDIDRVRDDVNREFDTKEQRERNLIEDTQRWLFQQAAMDHAMRAARAQAVDYPLAKIKAESKFNDKQLRAVGIDPIEHKRNRGMLTTKQLENELATARLLGDPRVMQSMVFKNAATPVGAGQTIFGPFQTLHGSNERTEIDPTTGRTVKIPIPAEPVYGGAFKTDAEIEAETRARLTAKAQERVAKEAALREEMLRNQQPPSTRHLLPGEPTVPIEGKGRSLLDYLPGFRTPWQDRSWIKGFIK